MKSPSIFLLEKAQFEHWVRIAQTIAESTLGIPSEYRGNVGNCLNAIEIGLRLNVSPISVMQNLRNMGEGGNPVWSANFVRAMIDNSGLFSEPLRFEIESQSSEANYRVRAVATDLDGKLKVGDWINWTMVHLMGWGANTNWQAMPEVMFRARAGNAFGNEHCNSLLMGFLEDDAKAGSVEAVVTATTVTPQPATDFASLMNQVQTAQVPLPPPEEGKAEGNAPRATPMDKPTTGIELKPAELVAPPVAAPAQSILGEISAVMQMTETAKIPANPSQEGKAVDVLTDPGKSEEKAEPKAEPKVRKPRAPKVVEPAGVETAPPSLLMNTTEDKSPAPASETAAQAPDAHLARELERAALFSNAMQEIENAAPTKTGLEAAIAVANGFGEPERVDLYGLILDQAGAQIEKMAQKPKGIGEAEKAFLATARTLHSGTKDLVISHPEIAPNRARLSKAYTAMINVVAQLTAAAKEPSI